MVLSKLALLYHQLSYPKITPLPSWMNPQRALNPRIPILWQFLYGTKKATTSVVTFPVRNALSFQKSLRVLPFQVC